MRTASVADLVDVEPAGLAAAVRARLAEAGCDRDDHRVLALRARELELAPLRDGALVDVPGEHEVGARLDEPGEDSVPLRDRLLARAPGRAEQMVVEGDDPQRALGRVLEDLRRVLEPARRERRPDWWRHGRTELSPTTTRLSDRYTGSVVSQSRSNSCQGLVKRFGNEYGMSWLPGIVSSGSSSPRRNAAACLVLGAETAVGEVAARDHELRTRLLDEPAERLDRLGLVVAAEVEVGEVKDSRRHGAEDDNRA